MGDKVKNLWGKLNKFFYANKKLALLVSAATITAITVIAYFTFAGTTVTVTLANTGYVATGSSPTQMGSVTAGVSNTSNLDYISCGSLSSNSIGSFCSSTITKSMTLTATAMPDFSFKYFVVNGTNKGLGVSTITIPATANANVSAYFEAVPFTVNLSVNNPAMGSVSPATITGGKYTDHQVTAVPNAGYFLGSWAGDCTIMSGQRSNPASRTITVRIWGPIATCTANFMVVNNPDIVSLTTSTEPANAGTITRAPADAAYYALGFQVTLTATPYPGNDFLGWSECSSATESTITLTMDAHKTCKANFKVPPPPSTTTTLAGNLPGASPTTTPTTLLAIPTVAVNAVVVPAEAGNITKSPQKATYAVGETVNLTVNSAIVPGKYYRFTGWAGCSTSLSRTISLTVSGTNPIACTANFVELVKLTVTKTGLGAISQLPAPRPDGLYSKGTIVTLTATPEANNRLKSWGCSTATPVSNVLQLTLNAKTDCAAVFVESVLPTTPEDFYAEEQSGFISLGWTESTDNVGIKEYRLEKRIELTDEEREAGYSPRSWEALKALSPTVTTYSDVTVSGNNSYEYQIKAVDINENESAFSESTATPYQLAFNPVTTVPPAGVYSASLMKGLDPGSIKILIIGNNFNLKTYANGESNTTLNKARFLSYSRKMRNSLSYIEPYKSNFAAFSFEYEFNTYNRYGCYMGAPSFFGSAASIDCNINWLENKKNNANADYVMLVDDRLKFKYADGNYGGGGAAYVDSGIFAMTSYTYDFSHSTPVQRYFDNDRFRFVALHEFSHIFADLNDEYVYWNKYGPITNTFKSYTPDLAYPNYTCFAGAKTGWTKGCLYSNWSREFNSMMSTSLKYRLNEKQKNLIKGTLRNYIW